MKLAKTEFLKKAVSVSDTGSQTSRKREGQTHSPQKYYLQFIIKN
jgi:hypothetical protein